LVTGDGSPASSCASDPPPIIQARDPPTAESEEFALLSCLPHAVPPSSTTTLPPFRGVTLPTPSLEWASPQHADIGRHRRASIPPPCPHLGYRTPQPVPAAGFAAIPAYKRFEGRQEELWAKKFRLTVHPCISTVAI
jgi:hypothetical protein